MADNAYIGNLNNVENHDVNVDQNVVVAGLEITDGMQLNTNGHRVFVLGDVTVSGMNSVGNDDYPSTILIEGGSDPDFDVDQLNLTDFGIVRLTDQAILDVDERLTVCDNCQLRGSGVINLNGNAARALVVDGYLDPSSDGMVINQLGTALIDLDGDLGDSTIALNSTTLDGSATDNLTINGTVLHDEFNGNIMMVGGGFLNMNLSGGWTAGTGSFISLFGPEQLGAAEIRGGHFTLEGTLSASTDSAIIAPTTIQPDAEVFVASDGLLRFQNAATVSTSTRTSISSGRRRLPGEPSRRQARTLPKALPISMASRPGRARSRSTASPGRTATPPFPARPSSTAACSISTVFPKVRRPGPSTAPSRSTSTKSKARPAIASTAK
ncbi:MAG: hypothetical protein WD851_13210 [Pirellulales bacterium]